MIEISPSYALNKSNVNTLDIQAFYAENQPKIEVATSDISGAITALAAAQESERFRNEAEAFRNEAEGFSELTNSDRLQTELDRLATSADRVATGEDRVQTGLDRIATTEDRQVVEAYVGDINNLVTIPFTQFAIDLIRTQTIVVEHHGFT